MKTIRKVVTWKHVAMMVCSSAIACAVANDFTLKNGATDWTSPASYVDNPKNLVPSSSDRIFTEEGATNELLPSDAKYADSLAKINEVVQVQLGKHAMLVIAVADGNTNTITGRIGCIGSAGVNDAPVLVKKGGGTLLQEPSEKATYYFSRWQVEAGTLGAPWATSPNVQSYNIYCYGIDLGSNTSLILPYKQNFQVLGPLSGAGSIVTLNPDAHNDRCSPLYLKGGPGEFSGSIGTNIYVYVREGAENFSGTANRYNGGLVVSGFKDDGTDKGVLGFTKFGASASDPSSLGLRGTVTLGELYASEHDSACRRIPLSWHDGREHNRQEHQLRMHEGCACYFRRGGARWAFIWRERSMDSLRGAQSALLPNGIEYCGMHVLGQVRGGWQRLGLSHEERHGHVASEEQCRK